MKSFQLLRTRSKSGAVRFFIDGKRVSRDAFDLAKFWRRVDCLLTTNKGGIIRDYSTATITD